MPAGLFGITNDALNLAVNLLILFLVVLWLALVAWTYFDARRRIEDPVLIACATAASLFPFLGTIVYSILRPPEFLADRHERELEVRTSELRVRQLEEASCPNCEHPIERSFLRCPNCRARIKDPCESCGKPIDPRWSICPYCETPSRRAVERRPAPKRRGKQPSREGAQSRETASAKASRSRPSAKAEARSARERPSSAEAKPSRARASATSEPPPSPEERSTPPPSEDGDGETTRKAAPSRSGRSSRGTATRPHKRSAE